MIGGEGGVSFPYLKGKKQEVNITCDGWGVGKSLHEEERIPRSPPIMKSKKEEGRGIFSSLPRKINVHAQKGRRSSRSCLVGFYVRRFLRERRRGLTSAKRGELDHIWRRGKSRRKERRSNSAKQGGGQKGGGQSRGYPGDFPGLSRWRRPVK